ncbi:unnamed protein product [Arctogadus glacialis]
MDAAGADAEDAVSEEPSGSEDARPVPVAKESSSGMDTSIPLPDIECSRPGEESGLPAMRMNDRDRPSTQHTFKIGDEINNENNTLSSPEREGFQMISLFRDESASGSRTSKSVNEQHGSG